MRNDSHCVQPCVVITKSLSQRGIALVLVLWLLAILMTTALTFSFMARTDAYSTLSFREDIENKYLAEAGVQRGIQELYYWSVNKNQTVTLEGKELLKLDGRAYYGKLGNGSYQFRVTDESGKININALTDTSGIMLKNLLLNAGVPEEQADVIVDSVLDWKDADDFHRLHGAESDDYRSLPNPYKAKNANFDTLEELLLVKGMTPEILYGHGEKKGIIDCLTIGEDSSFVINVNVAPRNVLMAIPGANAETADLLISDRESDDPMMLKKMVEDIRIATGPKFALISQFISTGNSGTFSIDATGFKESEKKGFAIHAVVKLDSNNTYRYVYYKSPVDR